MVGMGQAFKNFWRHGFDFKGQATRAEYWWMALWGVILGLIGLLILVAGVFGVIFGEGLSMPLNPFYANLPMIMIIMVILGLVIFIPAMALTVRRLRDAGLKTWIIWVLLVLYFVLPNPTTRVNMEMNLFTVLERLVALIIFICTVLETDQLKNLKWIGREEMNLTGQNGANLSDNELTDTEVTVEVLYPKNSDEK
ncbi:DUF805 domain-containing protein [Weissella kandleri]|uniref:DUF805 domain-containing protein n=1 Tax=Weissella kandleri TaxID=1616 RepID=UPI00387EC1C0